VQETFANAAGSSIVPLPEPRGQNENLFHSLGDLRLGFPARV
jgi:hypothetical protein